MQNDDMSGIAGVVLSDYDYLTKALSKMEFEIRAKRILDEMPESRHLMAIINIDGFREINSKHGYVQGDALLCATAQRISAVCDDGIVGRVEGDVFAVLFCETPTYRKAEELLCELNTRVRMPLDGCAITCTIGGAWYPDEASGYDELAQCAEARLVQAKSMGSNRFCLSRLENE